MSNEQLTRLPPPVIDWQARAEEAEARLLQVRMAFQSATLPHLPSGSHYLSACQRADDLWELRMRAWERIGFIIGTGEVQ